MAVALVLLAVVGGNVYSLLEQSSSSLGTKQSSADLDTQARRTMDRIAMALIGATADGLVLPPEQPNSTPSLNYRTNLGMQDGAMTFSDPMRIEFMNSIVSWYENPNAPNEKHVVWTKDVPAFLDGEIDNGIDDNANGIRDETGLAFVKNGKSITIYLSVRRTMSDGQVVSKSLSETVTCRN
jgi:hypothetical protein